MEIKLRKIELKDLEDYYHWNLPERLFHDYNGPYFKRETIEELKQRIEQLRINLQKENKHSALLKSTKKVITDLKTDKLIGEVSWYWKSQETLWMEIGILIFNENYWNKGIGVKALKIWITELFNQHNEICRIGLTTWSGNIGMVRVAEKLQMKQEALYRKARIVNNKYYDSISYGILREEWNNIHIE